MILLPEEIDKNRDNSFEAMCFRVCASMKPSRDRRKDEEYLLTVFCRKLEEKRDQRYASFDLSSETVSIGRLREHLILLVGSKQKSNNIFGYIEEFLDNVYPKN